MAKSKMKINKPERKDAHFQCEKSLYDEFEMACGDIYRQLFFEWAEKNELNF